MKNAAVLIVLVWVATNVGDVRAATGPECDLFEYQEMAQEALDRVAADYPSIFAMFEESLDPDHNGVACDQLPAMPEVLASAFDIRGGFGISPFTALEEPVISGLGYSARYDVNLAGISYEGPRGSECDELLLPDSLNAAINEPSTEVSHYYVTLSNGDRPPPDKDDQRYEITGLAWTIAGDPQDPILVNQWLLSKGLGVLDERTVPEDREEDFRKAEAEAREESLGIWGACTLPPSLKDSGPDTAGAYDHFLRESGDGDQVHAFTIKTAGLYQFTVDAAPGRAVFVAMDVYSDEGTWIPTLSVTTAEGGEFSSAAYLEAGQYYFQIKAVGSWRVTVDLT